MLHAETGRQNRCDGLRRREALNIGGLGALGLSLPGLFQGRATAATESASQGSFGKAKSCIVLFLMGGPDQHSTFDPKPQAPSEVRGEFGAIQTVVPGFELGELWPRTALLTDRLALIRAMSTGDNAHSSSGYYMLTGHAHAPMNAENVNPGFPNDFPNIGATVRHFAGSKGQLPAAVRLPHRIFNTDASVWPGQDAGFLGQAVDPWLVNCHPADRDFRIDESTLSDDVDAGRLLERRSLLQRINVQNSDSSARSVSASWEGLTERAFDVLNSSASRRAFELHHEPAVLRDRYGRSQFGQSVLMSRRLIEADVSLVQVNWFRGPDEPSNAPCWDSHANESQRLKTALCPPADQALSALIEDLETRGRLQETLIVVMAEFGRSPRINGAGGRDHWGNVFSVALAGGGIQGGVIHGASDAIGAYPQDGKVAPQDLSATMFHCMGLDPMSEIRDTLGRPHPISRGEVIRGILV